MPNTEDRPKKHERPDPTRERRPGETSPDPRGKGGQMEREKRRDGKGRPQGSHERQR